MSVSVQPSTTGSSPPYPKEALRPVFDFASRLAQLPVIVTDSQGRMLGSSRDADGTCAVASGKATLTRSPSNQWSCTATECPHHSNFCCGQIHHETSLLGIVHCQGRQELEAFADLAQTVLTDYHDKYFILDEIARVYEEINWIYSLGDILKKVDNRCSTFEEIFQHIGGLLPIRQAEVWAPDQDAALYRCLAHYDNAGLSRNQETVGRSAESDRLLQNMGLRIIRGGIQEEPPLDSLLDAFTRKLKSPLVVVPLETKSQFLGVLLLCLADCPRLNSSQIKLLGALGRQVSLCVHLHLLIEELRANEGFRRELEIAREIQHSLLPQRIPSHGKYDLFAGCVTAAHVGGDYYDFFERNDELGMLIADVSGHSVGSGLIAMSFRSSFRHHLEMHLSMDDILGRVNRKLCRELHNSGHFLSAFLCSYSPSNRQLRYVNAGHNRPFVLRGSTGEFLDLDEAGLLIGILENSTYPVGQIALQEGDILVLYTDGIVEAENQNGDPFGLERLKDAVRRYSSRSAKALYHYLLREMYVFQDERFNMDDVTLVILKLS